jgi:hypothetical protein
MNLFAFNQDPQAYEYLVLLPAAPPPHTNAVAGTGGSTPARRKATLRVFNEKLAKTGPIRSPYRLSVCQSIIRKSLNGFSWYFVLESFHGSYGYNAIFNKIGQRRTLYKKIKSFSNCISSNRHTRFTPSTFFSTSRMVFGERYILVQKKEWRVDVAKKNCGPHSGFIDCLSEHTRS